jgi:hypothetical protein
MDISNRGVTNTAQASQLRCCYPFSPLADVRKASISTAFIPVELKFCAPRARRPHCVNKKKGKKQTTASVRQK